MISEYDGNNNLLRKYIYGSRVDEPVCMIEVSDSNTYYYHFDALGSVVALSDVNGDTVQTYEYSVYGQVAAEDPNHPNPCMFTGRRFDIEIGLYYNRARYYNPFMGRFLQTDPVGYEAGMNLYTYCRNNPLAFVDPSGLWAVIDFIWNEVDNQHLTLLCWDDVDRKHLGVDFHFYDWIDFFAYVATEGTDFCDIDLSRTPTASFSGFSPSPELKDKIETAISDKEKSETLILKKYEYPWWTGPVLFFGEAAEWICGTYRETDGYRTYAGATFIATGGSLVAYVLIESNPAGWALGAACVCAEIGGILVISDLPTWQKIQNPLVKIRNLREEKKCYNRGNNR